MMKPNLNMDFLTRLFTKKPTAGDVLKALDSFSNDQKSLEALRSKAASYFGDNWKFNLEMYINALPPEDKARYSKILENAFAFDRALALWIAAEQVIRGTRTFSGDMLKDLPSFEEYLPKFGIEGRRLLEKFKEKLSISGKPKKNDRMLHKVSKEELTEAADDGKSAAHPTAKEESAPPKEKPAPKAEDEAPAPPRPVEEHIEIGAQADGSDWEIQNFVRMHNFLSTAREVMPAIVLSKNASAIENYAHYGFILDAIDYLVAEGGRILEKKSDAAIRKYLKGGKAELKDMVDFHLRQKDDEIVPAAAKKKPNESEGKPEYTKVNQAAEP
ncbi:MAG: hypothetical protein LBO78_00625 [Rickettsiales bacterium]|jgi:hypothetical protein|nr:hypothetical protein [Rickettsiales bacterium]